MEVLASTVVVGIAVVGIALMFGKGSAWVAASGDDRVASGLAQDRIERILANGWGALGTPAEPIGPHPPLDLDQNIVAGNNHVFTRTVCIQYVDPGNPIGLTNPAYDPTCPAGAVTTTTRITVVVTSRQPEASPVTLQAWMTKAGP